MAWYGMAYQAEAGKVCGATTGTVGGGWRHVGSASGRENPSDRQTSLAPRTPHDALTRQEASFRQLRTNPRHTPAKGTKT